MATGVFPTATMTNTTLANVIPSLWTNKMNDYYRSQLVAGKFFMDLSSEFDSGAKIAYIPNVTAFTATNRTDVTAAVTLQNATDTNITLTIDTWYECSFAISDKDMEQVKKSYNYVNVQAQNCAYEVGKAYESAILALFTGFSQTVGTSAAGLADSNIRRAIQYLDEANVPQADRAFFVTPKMMWSDLMSLDKFTLAINTAGANNPITKGANGYLYGYPVFVSALIGSTLGSANAAYAHKDAIAHGSSLMKVQTNYIPQYLSTITTAQVVFGAIENRDTSGVWIKTAAA
jgi:hypothetical protein